MPATLRLVVARFATASDADAAQRRLAAHGVDSNVLVRGTGWFSRLLGRRGRFLVGVAAADFEKARSILGG